MRFLVLRLAIGIFCLLHLVSAPVCAKDNWLGVRSPNFSLIGNAGEKDIRRIAFQLEQFRDAFTRLLKGGTLATNIPVTVVVCKNRNDCKPFNLNNNAGYFQPGPDVNYIILSVEATEDTPFSAIYHDYVHFLLNQTSGNVPAWLSEGLAEYYSTFRVTDDRRVALGDALPGHILSLRQEKMLPLRTLFAIDHASPYYHENSRNGIFYAQSWALAHYLALGKSGPRAPQLSRFLQLMAAGQPPESAFTQAFQTPLETLEKELREYVRENRFPAGIYNSEQKPESAADGPAALLSEADALAFSGDLLLHIKDYAGAETRLQQALLAEPQHPLARAALGMLRVRQRRFSEALNLLRSAAAADAKNYLAHYYYAFALSRVGLDASQMTGRYTPADVAQMRSALLQAITLAPTFPESYALLAFVDLVAGDQLAEAAQLLRRVLFLAPGRSDLAFMLAQVYLRQQDFTLARQTIEPLTHTPADPQQRSEAENLLKNINELEAIRANGGIIVGDLNAGPHPPRRTDIETELKNVPTPDELLQQSIREALRPVGKDETRIEGWLAKLECDNRGVAYFIVRAEKRLYKIRAYNLSTLQLVAYTPQAGRNLGCGPRKPEDHVLITFRPATDAKDTKATIDGDAIALELVPKNFQLNP